MKNCPILPTVCSKQAARQSLALEVTSTDSGSQLIEFPTELEDQTQVLIASLIAKADDNAFIDGLLEALEPERHEAEIRAIKSNRRAADRKRFAQRIAKHEAAQPPRIGAQTR